jgi:phosphatidylglycerophosphate synthase
MNVAEPLLPLVVLTAFFIFALPLFALHVRRHGIKRDDRIEQRKVGPLVGRWLMYYLLWLISPVEKALVRLRVPPNLLTLSSLILSAGAAAAVAVGRFGLGGWLYLFTGVLDILDGRVARASGRATKSGAFYDSIVDRWAEALIFGGLAWNFRAGWVLFLVLGGLVASFMVSYARARGEALGAGGGDGGAMQRPERVLYLGVGIALSPMVTALGGPDKLLTVIAVGLVAAISLVTATARTLVVYRQLRGSGSYGTATSTSSAVPARRSGPLESTTNERGASMHP